MEANPREWEGAGKDWNMTILFSPFPQQMPDNSVTDKVSVLFRRIIESPSIKQKNQIKPTMRLLKKMYKRVRNRQWKQTSCTALSQTLPGLSCPTGRWERPGEQQHCHQFPPAWNWFCAPLDLLHSTTHPLYPDRRDAFIPLQTQGINMLPPTTPPLLQGWKISKLMLHAHITAEYTTTPHNFKSKTTMILTQQTDLIFLF